VLTFFRAEGGAVPIFLKQKTVLSGQVGALKCRSLLAAYGKLLGFLRTSSASRTRYWTRQIKKRPPIVKRTLTAELMVSPVQVADKLPLNVNGGFERAGSSKDGQLHIIVSWCKIRNRHVLMREIGGGAGNGIVPVPRVINKNV
jgi:hypothetical protein